MIKKYKILSAALLCAASISSVAAPSLLKASVTGAPVITINFAHPMSRTTYAQFVLNGHKFDGQPVDGSDAAMYFGNKGISYLVRAGYLNLNQKNTFDFYQCPTETCISRKPTLQTTHTVVVTRVSPNVYAANPDTIGVKLK